MAKGEYMKKQENQQPVLIESIGIPPRVIGILKNHSIVTLSDVSALTKKDLLKIPGIGEISARIIQEKVEINK